MKNLGGFAVKLFENGKYYRASVDLELQDAPKGAIVGGVMTLILQLTELDPRFPDMLAKVMGEHLAGNLEVRKAEDEE